MQFIPISSHQEKIRQNVLQSEGETNNTTSLLRRSDQNQIPDSLLFNGYWSSVLE